MRKFQFLLVSFSVLCVKDSQGRLQRLRNTAVKIPDLAPIQRGGSGNNNSNESEVDAGFEQIEAKLEQVFFQEVFRLDASMSFEMSYTGGGGADSDSSSDDSRASGGTSGTSDESTPGGSSTNGAPSDNTPSGGLDNDNGGSAGGENDGSMVYEKCGVSEQTRSDALFGILSTISDPSELEDMSSPRHYAKNWIEKEDAGVICTDNEARVLQRYRAALIYFHFNGDNWSNCRAQGGSCFQEDSTSVPAIPFLDASNECLWFGLSCANVPREVLPSQRDTLSVDAFEPITAIDISDNNLSGELFDEIFGLVELQELTLDGNKNIRGTIPEKIGQLTKLVAIDIDDNKLSGLIPQSIYSLKTLEAIDLNSNALTGTISDDIGNLENLVVVQLDNNDLTGPMPAEGIFNLEKLAVWTVLDNDLTGNVENVCGVVDERRVANEFPGYLQFFWVDCLGNPPQVECSCCECQEPQSPTSF